MYQENFEALVVAGTGALAADNARKALDCFEKALKMKGLKQTGSCLAYCMARVQKNYPHAIILAREAIDREPGNPLHYLNLGRIYHLAGNFEQAIFILRNGLEFGMHREIMRELESIGIRKPPLFRKLPRGHIINKFAGIILSRLGLR